MENDDIHDIVVDFVRGVKKVSEVNIVMTELKDGFWVVRGTCPIDLDGHPWRESFEVIVDLKGKIKTSNFRLV